jgi:hypothetical protein
LNSHKIIFYKIYLWTPNHDIHCCSFGVNSHWDRLCLSNLNRGIQSRNVCLFGRHRIWVQAVLRAVIRPWVIFISYPVQIPGLYIR